MRLTSLAREVASRMSRRPGPLTAFLGMIRFSHSVFALPFALVSMLVAADGWPRFATIVWIVAAVVAARTAAMCFNRIVDREYDARNPRTKNRELVTGVLSLRFAYTALALSIAAFVACAAMLNTACLVASPIVLVVLLGYSITKRFTHWSHLVLGLALGLAPVGAWVAVTGWIAWFPVILALAVLLWVAGFDILYACQDYEHDRVEPGLHSIPKTLGLAGAMLLARRIHAVALLAFVLAWWVGAPPLGIWFLVGIVGAGALLVYQHSILSPRDLSRINAAFFTANGLISIGLFVAAVLDLLTW